ncbi:MAG: hypothetical protein CVU57_22730 [Deltaproteobacteria bacterium HGW-Deltaproteobacteria-15]|nr:MAG: hypothetical protein CVU57_22730 [Deltaproteobacteria bacterium HGW-Deltaproteobacteria-15]
MIVHLDFCHLNLFPGFRASDFEFIEAPCSKLQGIFDLLRISSILDRSLTPQQAAGLALAVSVQDGEQSTGRCGYQTL